jgi:uncharacterized protein
MSGLVQIGRFNFRFVCQPGCVNCCQRPGDVFLTNADRDRIAAWLGLDAAEFERRYCERSGGELRLSIPARDSCHFLLEGGCAIHDVKPLQCRTFPFWPENVTHKRAWKSLSQFCPGIGVGEILPREDVRQHAAACGEAFPDLE